MVSGHAKATVDGTVIAETDQWEEVEGNVYFPPSAVKSEYLTETDLHTTCSWKGDASYYTIGVNGKELKNAAWFYPTPKDKAQNIKDYVAFYKTKVDITVN
ncbi:putative duf427 domain protein [Phaeoacremonium minimum UCRPA7]|uniref:Putative duf427 domain protein n=1 Tax=Phaeoacremonium minimum (strain UCR-PA7) TaxID=1286976 RepID=R8BX80_PHAM7|nr:putative duf427 domain protein [Phaeoacremonium minimum UCRPA7]EOO03963.1 putative duf427 domain protein [Phaeoacremonium minimum UCRPA7]